MNRGNNGDGSYCSKECRYKNKMRWTQKEKRGAKNFIRIMIKKGIVIPKPCVICSKKAQAHHYKGYDRKNWLDIESEYKKRFGPAINHLILFFVHELNSAFLLIAYFIIISSSEEK